MVQNKGFLKKSKSKHTELKNQVLVIAIQGYNINEKNCLLYIFRVLECVVLKVIQTILDTLQKSKLNYNKWERTVEKSIEVFL